MSEGPHKKLRRAARVAIVQALYQMDMSEDTGPAVIRQFMDHRFLAADGISDEKVDKDFFEDVILGVIKFQNDVDSNISEFLTKGWTLGRIDSTLRAILRASCYEILRRPDVPALVIIDQYVGIASDFFEGREPGFVNGIAENIAKKIRAVEFGLVGS